MRLRIGIIILFGLLVAGILVCPRPDPGVSADAIISKALTVEQNPNIPIDEVKRRLASGCKPIFEGSDTMHGTDVWAVRLKIPPPKRYPWIEVWVDKKTSRIVAWKEWGRRNGSVMVLAQYPPKQ